MSLIISKKEPRYQLISKGTKGSGGIQSHHPVVPHLVTLSASSPRVTPCHVMTIDQWERHYRGNLIEMCDNMFEALCSADIEGYTMVMNRNMLYNRLVRVAYPASYNTSRIMRDTLRNN